MRYFSYLVPDMKLIIKKLPETTVTYAQLTDLIHAAFEERLQQGLNFTCSRMSEKDFERRMKDGTVFVALDEETGELLGTVSIFVKTDYKGRKYGYHEYLAVSPKAKHMGVATQLTQAWTGFAHENGLQYIKSDTATRAYSSVKWHLKNGFHKYGVVAFDNTDYVSYLFIKYLDCPTKRSPIILRLRYIYSRFRYFLSFQKRRI